MAGAPEIYGLCEKGFERVRMALAQNFLEHGEVGAAVAITLEGTPVVDLWGGWEDRAQTRPWRHDTLVNVFSVGKAMAALSLLILVERGHVQLEAPVAHYWPEFAARGKGGITVRMLLCHQAGLPGIRKSLPALAMYDWDLMVSALADEEPWWESGRQHGYHVNTFGFLVGELVRRVTRVSFGEFFQRNVADLVDADFHFGIGPEQDERIADHLLPESDDLLVDFLFASEPPRLGRGASEQRRALQQLYVNPPGISGFGTVNTRAWRAAQMPSTNGHATACAVAKIYSALACGGIIDGVRLLRLETIETAITEASCGLDLVLGRPSRFGLGFQLNREQGQFGPHTRSFGHFGAGGSVGFADPDARLAFSYTMNQPGPRWHNPRNRALIDAMYASL